MSLASRNLQLQNDLAAHSSISNQYTRSGSGRIPGRIIPLCVPHDDCRRLCRRRTNEEAGRHHATFLQCTSMSHERVWRARETSHNAIVQSSRCPISVRCGMGSGHVVRRPKAVLLFLGIFVGCTDAFVFPSRAKLRESVRHPIKQRPTNSTLHTIQYFARREGKSENACRNSRRANHLIHNGHQVSDARSGLASNCLLARALLCVKLAPCLATARKPLAD